MLDLARYAGQARRTLPANEPREALYDHLSLGLIEEMGELVAAFRSEERHAIVEEFGDVIWYLVMIQLELFPGSVPGGMPEGQFFARTDRRTWVLRSLNVDVAAVANHIDHKPDDYGRHDLGRAYYKIGWLLDHEGIALQEVLDQHLAKLRNRFGNKHFLHIEDWKKSRVPR